MDYQRSAMLILSEDEFLPHLKRIFGQIMDKTKEYEDLKKITENYSKISTELKNKIDDKIRQLTKGGNTKRHLKNKYSKTRKISLR